MDDRSGRALERRVEPAEQAADVRHRHLAQRGGQAAGAPLIGERASVLRIQGAGGSETAPAREPGGRPRESALFEFVTGEVQDLEWMGRSQAAAREPGHGRQLRLPDGPSEAIGDLDEGRVAIDLLDHPRRDPGESGGVLDRRDELGVDERRLARHLELVRDARVFEEQVLDLGRVAVDLRRGGAGLLQPGLAVGQRARIEAEVHAAAVQKCVEDLETRRLHDLPKTRGVARHVRVVGPCVASADAPGLGVLLGIGEQPGLSLLHAEDRAMAAPRRQRQHALLATPRETLQQLREADASHVSLETHRRCLAGRAGVLRSLSGRIVEFQRMGRGGLSRQTCPGIFDPIRQGPEAPRLRTGDLLRAAHRKIVPGRAARPREWPLSLRCAPAGTPDRRAYRGRRGPQRR